MEIISKLSIEFGRIDRIVREAYISVGMITVKKYDFFIRNLKNGSKISIVVGIHMPTSPEILEKLKIAVDGLELQARVFTDKYFHPKVYLFKLEDGWTAFVGSGNFTDGGWHENEELFIKISDETICESLKDQHIRHLVSKFLNYR